MPPREPPKLTWLERTSSWLLPPVLRDEGEVAEAGTGRVRIRLRLEDGALVEVPLKQDTIAGLAKLLSALAKQ
jgi:hypothetical protein